MTEFTFNLGGIVYQSGIKTLRKAYEATETALSMEIDEAATVVAAYEKWLDEGGATTLERDEDGEYLDSNLPYLEHQHSNAEDALVIMRKAFAVTIYHYWEKWSQRWFGRNKKGHAEFVKRLEQEAVYSIHPGMTHFYWLVNILKHNRPDEAPQLLKERPDFFFTNFKGFDEPDWEWGVGLTGKHIAEFLDIIAASGPTGNEPDIKFVQGLI